MEVPFNTKQGNGGVLVGQRLPGMDAPDPTLVVAKVNPTTGFAEKPPHPVDKTITDY